MKSRVYGAGMDAALVDATSAAALDTYSQATITFTNNSGASATQPRYKVNGVLDTGQSVLANIDRIMAACDSWNQYNEASGKWAVVINKATSSTFAFDDNNIIGEIKTSLLDLTSSINQVEAQFPSALNRDQRDVVYIETPTILLYANEPINKYSCSFDLVNDSVQANYLANRMLEQAREDLNVTINAAYPAIQVDAGDVVTLTNAAYGWNNKLFRAMKVSEICLADGNLGATLELSEYNALVYDDNDIRQYNPTPNSNLNSASYFSALTAPTISATRPDNDIPSFDIAVVTPSVGRTTTLQLYYSTTATPTPSQWTLLDAFNSPLATSLTQSSTFTFLNQILPAGTYYFGVVAANDIGQSQISSPSTALIWTPTGTTGTQTATVYLYQWLMSTPGNPSGTSTYTWATATNSAYTGGNGWTTTIPSNPGTAGISLWQASIGLSALATATTSTVSWASGYAVNAISTNGSSGTSGTSAVRAYAIYSGNPTVTGASVTKSGTALPATTDFSPTSATAFTTTTQTPGASEAMFQSDGLYYPVTNQTVWNTPYLSNLKVGSLSAISADLGTITAGDLSIGSLPTLSGTGMTGTGSHFYSNGNYALGTSSKNLVFNGTDVYLNGNLIATDNINTNAVTISTGAYTTGSANLPLNGGSTTLQSLSYTSNGSPVYIAFTAVISYYAVLRSPGSGGTYYPFRQSWQILLYRNSTLILTNFAFALIAPDLTASITGSYPLAISFSDTPSSGSVTYDVVIQETTNSGQTGYNGAGGNYYYVYNRNLFTLETKK